MIDKFYGRYFFLSNFYECPVNYKGLTYNNTEAAFHAQKTFDIETQKRFTTLNPSEAKKLGRAIPLRPDWENVKVKIMEDIVTAKFQQHPDLQKKLIDTYPEELVEGNWWNDTFWGVCNGAGLNNLGKILMNIRDIFVKETLNG